MALGLSPSELVLFNGEKFADKSRVPGGNVDLLHMDDKVAGKDLAEAVWATAFLSLEQTGAIRMTERAQKSLFGLISATVLDVAKGEPSQAWPENSLEAQITDLIGKGTVSDIIVAILRKDSFNPYNQTIEMMKAWMAQRGLLEEHKEKKMMLFTSITYKALPETLILAGRTPVDPVQQVLRSTETGRPSLWKALQGQIKTAIGRRTTKDSG